MSKAAPSTEHTEESEEDDTEYDSLYNEYLKRSNKRKGVNHNSGNEPIENNEIVRTNDFAVAAVGIAALQMKKENDRATKIEHIADVTTQIATQAKNLLPVALGIAAGAGLAVGGAAVAATGIGLPIVIAAAIAVATIMRAHKQNIQLQILLNKQFHQLLFIIKNFTLVQQTLSLLEIDVPFTNEMGVATFKQIHVTLGEAFQDAVTQYMAVVQSQVPVVPPDPKGRSFMARAGNYLVGIPMKIQRFFSGGAVIQKLNELFPAIERFYLLEMARFTTLMFFNLDNFTKIVGRIKATTIYGKFAEAQLMVPVPPCPAKEGDEDDASCVLAPAVLEQQLREALQSIQAIVTPDEFKKGIDIETLYKGKLNTIVSDEAKELAAETKKTSIKDTLQAAINIGTSVYQKEESLRSSVASTEATFIKSAGGKRTRRRLKGRQGRHRRTMNRRKW